MHPAASKVASRRRLAVRGGVLGFAFALSLLTGIVFGIVPAWITSGSDPAEALHGVNRATRDRASLPQKSLIVLQAALSLVLLVAAGLLLRSFMLLQKVDVGTSAPPANVLTMMVTPKTLGKTGIQFAYDNGIISFYQRVMENVSRLPGVQYVAISDSLRTAGTQCLRFRRAIVRSDYRTGAARNQWRYAQQEAECGGWICGVVFEVGPVGRADRRACFSDGV